MQKKNSFLVCMFIFQCMLSAQLAAAQEFKEYTDPRDGHVYKTVQIGTQTWFAENLAYLPKVDPVTAGTPEEGPTKPHYYVPDFKGTDVNLAKKSDYYKKYGVLYNWAAARTICPPGWHLPTDEEWKKLERYLGMPEEKLDEVMFREEGKVGDRLKSSKQWHDPGADKLGFGALPGGFRFGNNAGGPANFGYINDEAYFWTATLYDNELAYRRQIVGGTHGVVRYMNYMEHGYSVRCVKDN